MTVVLLLILLSIFLSHFSWVYLYVFTKKYMFNFSKSLVAVCILIELYQLCTFFMIGISTHKSVSFFIISRESLFFLFGIASLFVLYRFLRKNIDLLFIVFLILAFFSIGAVITTETLLSGFNLGVGTLYIYRTDLYFHVVFFVVVIPVLIALFLLLRGRLTVNESMTKQIFTHISFGFMSALFLFFIMEFLLPLLYSPIHYLGGISLSILPFYFIYTVYKIKENGINKQITARFLFENVIDAVLIYDHGYHIVEYNASVSKFYPGKKHNLIGEHISNIIYIDNHRYDQPCIKKEVTAIINNVPLPLFVTQHLIKRESQHNGYLLLLNSRRDFDTPSSTALSHRI